MCPIHSQLTVYPGPPPGFLQGSGTPSRASTSLPVRGRIPAFSNFEAKSLALPNVAAPRPRTALAFAKSSRFLLKTDVTER